MSTHAPLISRALFEKVGDVLDGRIAKRSYETRQYLFRCRIQCATCSRHLYADIQKGHAYYRCHTDGCQGTCIRESIVVSRMLAELGSFPVTDQVIARFKTLVELKRKALVLQSNEVGTRASLVEGQLRERLERLTDAYLDRAIDRDTFEARKRAIENDRIQVHGDAINPANVLSRYDACVQKSLELLKSLQALAETANCDELGGLVRSTLSNCTITRKNVEFNWDSEATSLFADEPDPVCPSARTRTVPVQYTLWIFLFVRALQKSLTRSSRPAWTTSRFTRICPSARTRTWDQLCIRQSLYQLSYGRICWCLKLYRSFLAKTNKRKGYKRMTQHRGWVVVILHGSRATAAPLTVSTSAIPMRSRSRLCWLYVRFLGGSHRGHIPR